MIEAAPKLIDCLGDESRAHFEALQALLRDAGIAFAINPRLVRGLDYYNRTVFEWVTDRTRRAGHGVPAAAATTACSSSWAASPRRRAASRIGVERMILLLQDAGAARDAAPLAYVVHAGDGAAPLARRVGGDAARRRARDRRATRAAAASSRR